MLSHVVCQPTQPDGGEEVDAEAHVARSILQACVRVFHSAMHQSRHCMHSATYSAVRNVKEGPAHMFQVADKKYTLQLQSPDIVCLPYSRPPAVKIATAYSQTVDAGKKHFSKLADPTPDNTGRKVCRDFSVV